MWPNPSPQNIIVRMPNWLGDVVMATPVLADLRHHWPNAKITAMCQSNVAGLLKHDPHIDELFSFKRPSGWLHREHYRNILLPLRHGDYDLGILLTNSLSSALWFWRGHVRNRLGFTGNLRYFFLDKAIPFPQNLQKQHLVLTYKALLQPLGIHPSETSPALYLSEDEINTARELLRKQGVHDQDIVIGINPGAAFGSAKCWLPERFQELTERLLADPRIRIVYFGDFAGTSLVNQICSQMPDRVINLAGKTSLRELVSLIKLCHIFLTNDSGPMHIAAALKTPLLALFGSTSAIKTGPYQHGTIIHKHVSCSPCYQRTCPIDFRCMKEISVDEVYLALQKLIYANPIPLSR